MKDVLLFEISGRRICASLLLVAIGITFFGCAGPQSQVRQNMQVVPELQSAASIPDTVNVIYQRALSNIRILFLWGIEGKNRLDTASGTLTKNLVLDGCVTVPFVLPQDDAESILACADSIRFWQLPMRIAPPDTLKYMSMVTPCSEYLLRISRGSRTKTVVWDYCHTAPCAERERIEPLRKLLLKIVSDSEAYNELPKARGGYL
jgi:hypothetical protein